MSRLRAALPLLLLIATGALLVTSGALDAFRPERLATSQADLHASVAAHPALSTLVYIGVLALSIATGI
ncbi:MAG TPA: TVP38/TMEM64 family protein, partial [Mizugakiibacter sp.]